MVFAHGFGCDQNMWRFVAPDVRGRPPGRAVRPRRRRPLGPRRPTTASKYGSLRGYADDVLEICRRARPARRRLRRPLGQRDDRRARRDRGAGAVRPSWSWSARRRATSTTTATSAASAEPDIEELLDSLDSNYLGWSSAMAPVIMGNPDRPELGAELTNSFCRTDPEIARHFARVTFLSDNRADLARVRIAALVLQCSRRRHRARPRSASTCTAARREHAGPAARDRALPEPQRARRRPSRRSRRSCAATSASRTRRTERGRCWRTSAGRPLRERAVRLPVHAARTARSSRSTRRS